MLLLMKTGEAKSRSGAARYLGVHRHTIADWLQLYEEGGIEKIQEVENPGPDPGQQSIPSGVMEKLEKRLSEPESPTKQPHRNSAVACPGARRRDLLFDTACHRAV
jgi:transposase-like protein